MDAKESSIWRPQSIGWEADVKVHKEESARVDSQRQFGAEIASTEPLDMAGHQKIAVISIFKHKTVDKADIKRTPHSSTETQGNRVQLRELIGFDIYSEFLWRKVNYLCFFKRFCESFGHIEIFNFQI